MEVNFDHSYCKKSEPVEVQDKVFSIGQEYADDCSAGSTNPHLIDAFESTVPNQLKEHGLGVNAEKTEKFSIKHNGDETWKNTILLGSKLDTQCDISRRKGLASAAWNKYTKLLTSKTLPLLLRVKYFEAFVTSIFLYQCGIWTLTKKLNNNIDVFQRVFLRRIVGIRYPKKITNIELYKITNQRPWSEACKHRRLSLFGHTCRLPLGAPSREALTEALRPVKKLVGGQKTTLLGTIKSDLNTVGISIANAQQIAQDKKEFHKLINSVMSRSERKSTDQTYITASRRDD